MKVNPKMHYLDRKILTRRIKRRNRYKYEAAKFHRLMALLVISSLFLLSTIIYLIFY